MKNVDKVVIFGFQNLERNDNSIMFGTGELASKAPPGIKVTKIFYNYMDAFEHKAENMCKPSVAMTGAALNDIHNALRSLTDKSELILRGHGNVTMGTLSRVSGKQMAIFLHEMGLAANCKINITACKAARGRGQKDADAMSIGASVISDNSFARSLIDQLCTYGLRNTVHARVQNVAIGDAGKKTTRVHGAASGHAHKQAHSKIIFQCDAKGFASCRYAEDPA